MATNDLVPYWDPAEAITCHASGAITGKRLVAISGARVGDNPRVAQAGAGVKCFGVAGRDAASGAKVLVYGPNAVVPITAGGSITAGQELECDASGRVVTFASGVKVGVALDDATVGNDCPVRIYQ